MLLTVLFEKIKRAFGAFQPRTIFVRLAQNLINVYHLKLDCLEFTWAVSFKPRLTSWVEPFLALLRTESFYLHGAGLFKNGQISTLEVLAAIFLMQVRTSSLNIFYRQLFWS